METTCNLQEGQEMIQPHELIPLLDGSKLLWQAKLAALAYSNAVAINGTGVLPGGEWVEDLDSDSASAEGLVLHRPGGETITIFRGTEPLELKDYFTDVRVNLAVQNGFPGRVHAGFLDAILDTPIPLARRDEHATFIGHSLGGALALLAGVEWIGFGGKAEVVTFGQPRVGDKVFATAVETLIAKGKLELTRIVNDGDPIPLLPTTPFRHAGEERLLGPDGKFGSIDLAAKVARGLTWLLQPGTIPFSALKAHSIREYIRRLS